MRTTTHTLLAAMAFADMAFLIIVAPLNVRPVLADNLLAIDHFIGAHTRTLLGLARLANIAGVW